MNKALQILLAVQLLSGCSTTKQMDHWQAETFHRSQLNNVLIIAVSSNRESRFLFESVLEQRMRKAGLNGVKSLDVLGEKFPEKEAVEAYIANNNIDYVMATKLEDVNVEQEHIPPSVVTYYTGPYYPSYGAFYGNSITMVSEGYVESRTTLILATTIFDAKSGDPVWVGRSSTFEPGSIAYLAGDIARSTWNNIAR